MSGEYPKVLTHPNAVKGQAKPIESIDVAGRKVTDYQGTADRFPPVTVNNADQEARHRSKGYISATDKLVLSAYKDFPVWLVNAEGVEVLANTEVEENRYIDKGYQRKGIGNPEAVQRAYASPFDPDQSSEEWPKMVNGVLVQNPDIDQSGTQHYPMWVGNILVHDEEEERKHRDGKVFRDGKLVDGDKPSILSPEVKAEDTLPRLLAAMQKGFVVDATWNQDRVKTELVEFEELDKATSPISDSGDGYSEADIERLALIEEIKAKGIPYDKRWGINKLRAALTSEAA